MDHAWIHSQSKPEAAAFMGGLSEPGEGQLNQGEADEGDARQKRKTLEQGSTRMIKTTLSRAGTVAWPAKRRSQTKGLRFLEHGVKGALS